MREVCGETHPLPNEFWEGGVLLGQSEISGGPIFWSYYDGERRENVGGIEGRTTSETVIGLQLLMINLEKRLGVLFLPIPIPRIRSCTSYLNRRWSLDVKNDQVDSLFLPFSGRIEK
ncbi:hypothetical protein DQX05_22055 [Paenibacillus thiaminolyticus]|uniref:Uncharacterized protein n=1 Tax=Paenibacillus thiaminolyticus TaxID=49283 RepID=A0A3A3GYF9_PANTH|nr:hypothetical protein DQX05_22055 [Paenibacillus thiaminolyticus]